MTSCRLLAQDSDPTFLLRVIAQIKEEPNRRIAAHLNSTTVPPIGEPRDARHFFLDQERHRAGCGQESVQLETVRLTATARQPTRKIFSFQQSLFDEKETS